MTTTISKTTCCRAEVSICTDTGEPYCKACYSPAALTLETEPKVARLAADYTHCVYNTDITVPAGTLCHVLPCDGGEVYRLRPFTEYEILEEWDNEIHVMPEDAEDPEFVAPVLIVQEVN